MDNEKLSAWLIRASVCASVFGAIQVVTLLLTMIFIEPTATLWDRHFAWLEALKNAVHAFAYGFDGGFDNHHESSLLLLNLAAWLVVVLLISARHISAAALLQGLCSLRAA